MLWGLLMHVHRKLQGRCYLFTTCEQPHMLGKSRVWWRHSTYTYSYIGAKTWPSKKLSIEQFLGHRSRNVLVWCDVSALQCFGGHPTGSMELLFWILSGEMDCSLGSSRRSLAEGTDHERGSPMLRTFWVCVRAIP